MSEVKEEDGAVRTLSVRPTPDMQDTQTRLPSFTLESFHIAEVSDVYKGETHDYAGFVQYGQDGKSEWRMNGHHCKSGYTVIQDTARPDVREQPSMVGLVHGKVYMNVFGQDPTEGTVGEGFSIRGGQIMWNSYSFNAAKDPYHDSSKVASHITQPYLRNVLESWMMAGERDNSLGRRDFAVADLYQEVLLSAG